MPLDETGTIQKTLIYSFLQSAKGIVTSFREFGRQSLLLRLPDRQKLKNKLWQVHQTSAVA
jgi:hypothetical protein